ncbi:MAG: qor [Candidatus Eremiobacteraeota bacterium]|nr:qor [Candidatus Eremiobacteraeota bacterium]MDB5092951.1 qor [Candidatus Eremiobacteraeota bacterium]
MHAIVVERFGDPSVLEWREVPDPVPGPGELAIRVTATGVNFADIMRRQGGYRGAPPPFTPGLDCVGTVVAVGEGAHEFRVGQRVAAFPDTGSYAEIVLARPVLTYAVPDGVPDEAAASLTILVTAYNVLAAVARLQRGESVVITSGAGGAGSTAIQMARALGAGRIIATAGGAQKAAVAREAGADVAIDHTSVADLAAAVREANDGRAADVIIDAVAGDTFAQLIPALATFGRYVIYGMAAGKPGTVTTDVLHTGNRAVLGYTTGGYRAERPEALRPGVEAAFRMVAEGKVHVAAGKSFALRDAAEAQRFVESRASTGKVLLIP